MAIDNGTPNPDVNTSGADDKNTPNPLPNDGSRADTSRVAGDADGNTAVKEKGFTYKEDRADWVPRNRLNEESGKRTKLEGEVATLRGQIETEQKRVRAALGIETPSKDDQELQEMREALYKVNPKLKLLDRLNEEQLEQLLSAAETATSASRSTWERHRIEMLSELEDVASDLLGVEKLSEAQTKRLHRAFREEAREQAQARQKAERTQDPNFDYENDFVAKYERGDKKLLQEFAKSFIDEWGIPARRSQVASGVQRHTRPVPRGERNRTQLTQGPPKIDYNDDQAFKDALRVARADGGEV